MLFFKKNFLSAFLYVQSKSHESGRGEASVLILASTEPDAVCASIMLASLLQSSDVGYNITSVERYQDANDILDRAGSLITAVFLLGLGSTVDVVKTLKLRQRHESLRVFVVDARRPMHHVNVDPSNRQVCVLGDADLDALPENLPLVTDDKELLYTGYDEDEDEEEEEEEEEGFRSQPPSAHHDSPTRSVMSSSTSSSSSTIKRVRRTPTTTARSPSASNKSAESVARLSAYYLGSTIGDPVSHTMYLMLHQAKLTKSVTDDALWLALVAFTHRYAACEDYSHAMYEHRVGYYEDLARRAGAHIQPQPKELRLTTYRHVSLHEALSNAEQVAGRLSCWTEASRLDEFIARIGVPMRDALSEYASTSMRVKQTIATKLAPEAEKNYQIPDLTFRSFSRVNNVNSNNHVSAAGHTSALDVAAACAALLNGSFDGAAARFNRAFDALGSTPEAKALLNRCGIPAASFVQRELVYVVRHIMQHRLVNLGQDLRFVTLHDNVSEGLRTEDDGEPLPAARGPAASPVPGALLKHPAGVLMLTKFIVRAHRYAGKWRGKAAKPFLLVVDDSRPNGHAFVCGVPCPGELGEVFTNPFGAYFKTAARISSIQPVETGYFDECVVKIQTEDVEAFVAAVFVVMTGETR